jgi:septum formation protein
VRPVDCDETPLAGERPRDYVARVALEKARVAWQQSERELPVLGADTAVIVDDVILGKPNDLNHELEMLSMLSAREHQVLSAVALIADGVEKCIVQENRVFMRAISDAEQLAYWQSGEPSGKAGGYAVQGLGALFIKRIEGSYSGIMGLPVFETAELLSELGLVALSE